MYVSIIIGQNAAVWWQTNLRCGKKTCLSHICFFFYNSVQNIDNEKKISLKKLCKKVCLPFKIVTFILILADPPAFARGKDYLMLKKLDWFLFCTWHGHYKEE